jgi:hypothetical protein
MPPTATAGREPPLSRVAEQVNPFNNPTGVQRLEDCTYNRGKPADGK